ncbi:MAG: LacI family DNA-binding transcriptional regulator [Anaerolineales bacterium]|nr:LacI family DNA-binding transcriptional regulator [Anaerolineales bacterium]
MSGIKEVAKLAKVSTATVSRVLNHQSNVNPELRERVLAAVKDLDYHPSNIARNMRRQTSKIIGIVIPDISNSFFTGVVRGIEDIAHNKGYKVFLCNSDRNPEKEQMYIEVLAMERISGAIVVPYREENFQPFEKLNIPYVFVNQTLPGMQIASVVLDNFKGAYGATKHLIDKGHTRIGLINGPKNRSVETQRFIGYQKALLDSGIQIDANIIVSGELFADQAEEAADQILSVPDRPTALFALNNTLTIGTLKSISKHGLLIPGDISIVGFDDMPWLSFFTPPITVVKQPTYRIGTTAAQLLFEGIDNDGNIKANNVILEPEMIIRSSTAPPPHKR